MIQGLKFRLLVPHILRSKSSSSACVSGSAVEAVVACHADLPNSPTRNDALPAFEGG